MKAVPNDKKISISPRAQASISQTRSARSSPSSTPYAGTVSVNYS